MSQSRIIFIPGILTAPELQQFQWGKAAREMFPEREIVSIKRLYLYHQHDILCEIRDKVLDILQDGKPTVLVGHSFGGIIATAVAQQATGQGMENITRVVTWATPHTMNAPEVATKIALPGAIDIDIQNAREAVGYSYQQLNVPVYTQGARFDHLVKDKFTHFPAEERHVVCWGSHSGYWLNPRSWKFRAMWDDLRD